MFKKNHSKFQIFFVWLSLTAFYSLEFIKIKRAFGIVFTEDNHQNRPANSHLFINLEVLELETLETSQMLRLLNFVERNPFDPQPSAIYFLSIDQRESAFIQTEG